MYAVIGYGVLHKIDIMVTASFGKKEHLVIVMAVGRGNIVFFKGI
jgi:hypothetical protein